VLVMAGLAASVILGMLVSSMNNRAASGQALDLNATFIQALTEEHASTLEPLHLDRISELEQQ